MGRVRVVLAVAILICGLAPAEVSGCVERYLESDCSRVPEVRLFGSRDVAGECCEIPGRESGQQDSEAREVQSAVCGASRDCNVLVIYIGRGATSPVLCVVLMGSRQTSGNPPSSEAHWLREGRQVLQTLMRLIEW